MSNLMNMKRVIYRTIAILWLNILAVNCIPNTCSAWFWDDKLWLVKDIDVIGTDKWPSSSLLDTVKNTIKWILGILATVTFCFCLFAWFKMLTSWSDSKGYQDGRKILKNASIWLAIILLAWLITSAIIWFVKLQWWGWTTM